jgi:hypothetical protein
VHNEANPLAKAYHRVLVWDIMKRPVATRLAERVLSPVIGKSVVVYLTKPAGAGVGAENDAGRRAKEPADAAT